MKTVAAGGLLIAAALPFALANPAGAFANPSTPPAVPTSLTATSGLDTQGVADGTINLSWTASVSGSNGASAATGYNVYEGTTAGGESTTPVNGAIPVTGTSLSVPGLTDGTPYYFTVQAVNAYGVSPASNEASDTPAGIPSAPQNVSIASGNASATLNWTAPAKSNGSAVVGYNVYVTTTAPVNGVDSFVTNLNASNGGSWLNANGGVNGTNMPACAASGTYVPVNGPDCTSLSAYSGANLITGTSYTVTGLSNGTAYYYVVTAVNGVGESQGVLASSLSTTPGTVPAAVSNLSVSVSSTTATLSWGSNVGETYNVYEGTTAGGESTTALNAAPIANNGAGNSYVVSGLNPNSTYYFTIKAMNAVGSSTASNEVIAVTSAGVPSAPTGVSATPANTSATVSWTAPSNNGGSSISDYFVRYSTNGGVTWTSVDTTSTLTSYTVTGLTNGFGVVFDVYAVNSAGNGAVSATSASVTPNVTVPAAISNLAVSIVSGTATLSWTIPNAEGGTISGFNVYEGTATGAETLAQTVTNAAATSVALSVGSSGTYYFKVAAVSNVGTGAMSNEAYATSGATFASAPTGLTTSLVSSATTTGGTNAEELISFTPPTNDGGATVTSYDVYKVTNGDIATALTGVALSQAAGCTPGTPCVDTNYSDSTDYAIGGLTGGTSYQFVLVPVNSFGPSNGQGGNALAPSTLVSFTAANLSNAPTGVSAAQSGANVKVSWNAPLNADGTTAVAYNVYVNTANTPPGTLLATCPNGGNPCLTGSTSGASATVSNLTSGTTYYFWVTASNDGISYSAESLVASATPVSAPTFSVNPSEQGAAGSGTMTFNHGTLSSGTILNWSATASPGGLSCTGTSDATCTIVGLTNGVTYTITVSVTTATGSVSYTFTPASQPLGSPSAPGGVSASAQGTGASTYSATVNWTQPANGGSSITGYTVTSTDTSSLVTKTYTVASALWAYNQATAGGHAASESAALAYLGANVTSYCVVPSNYVSGGTDSTDASNQAIPASTTCTVYDINASASPTFTYVVAATNAQGTTASSASAAVSMPVTGTVPGAPTNFAAAPGATTSTVNLSWTAPSATGGSAILGYNVYEGSTSGGESTTPVNGVTLISGTSASIPNLTLGVKYYFTVVAVNANGASAPGYNASFTATEISYTALGAPGVATSLNATSTTGNSVNLTWTAPANDGGAPVTGYLVYAGTSAGGESTTPVNAALISGTSYTVTGLNSGTTYYFVVVADNGYGFSGISSEASAKTSGTSGGVPILPTVTGTYSVATFSTNQPIVVTGTGFTSTMTVSSSNTDYTVKLAGIGGIDASGAATTATLLVTTDANATVGTSTQVTFTNADGGSVSFTLSGAASNGGGTPTPRKLGIYKYTGHVTTGKTVTVYIYGVGFYGQPKITSNAVGTRIGVLHDNGHMLTVRVTVAAGTPRGIHTFTISFKNGSSVQLRYSQF